MSDFESQQAPRIKVKKKEALWLYSLTDLTFILMAFFAMMLSMAKPDRQKFDDVVAAVQPENPLAEKAAGLTVVAEDLEKVIQQLQMQDDARVQIDANGLLLEFSDSLVFTSGSAVAGEAFASTTDKLLRVLARAPDRYQISIEGHSDDIPIKSKNFKSNWELSASRGITLLNLLQERGMDPASMRVIAWAHTQPKVLITGKSGSDLQKARRANRRVVIRLN